MRFLLLLAVLASCAPAMHDTTYRQSAFPVAPAFNPAMDAPHTVGQPSYVGEPERLPVSQHRRVLPPTKEPGVWAGDEPQAALGMPFSVLGVYLGTASKQPGSEPVARQCATWLNVATMGTPNALGAVEMSGRKRECAATTLYAVCLTAMVRSTDANSPSMAASSALLQKMLAEATAAVNACKAVHYTPEEFAAWSAIAATFNRMVNGAIPVQW